MLTREISQSDANPSVTILIPARNSAKFLKQNFEQILRLNYPRDLISIYYGLGTSTDNSEAVIQEIISEYEEKFAQITLVKTDRDGSPLPPHKRLLPKYQLKRRRAMAKARNALLTAAKNSNSDWFLWIDSDVIGFPPDLIQRLLRPKAKIVTPECVLEPGGPSADLNTYIDFEKVDTLEHYKLVKYGLFQPPVDFPHRRYLHDFRYLDKIPLDSVGGTVLLVHADVHNAGLNMPEIPYKDTIETEAFARLACDLGVKPLGLPQLEVRHAKK